MMVNTQTMKSKYRKAFWLLLYPCCPFWEASMGWLCSFLQGWPIHPSESFTLEFFKQQQQFHFLI